MDRLYLIEAILKDIPNASIECLRYLTDEALVRILTLMDKKNKLHLCLEDGRYIGELENIKKSLVSN